MADKCKGFDPEETKRHILAAAREIMLAAEGALGFCRQYAEYRAKPSSRPYLISFFDKAISVADEIQKSMPKIEPVRAVANDLARSFFDRMGKEMESEKARPTKRGRAKPVAKKRPKARRAR